MSLSPVRRLRGLIFDLDGLFADTEPIQKRAFEQLCQRYLGPQFRLTDALHAEMVGRSDAENARMLVERFGIPQAPERLVEERIGLYVELLKREPVLPCEGVFALLEAGRARGMRLGIASSSVQEFVTLTLCRVFETVGYPDPPEAVFSAVVCGDDPRIRARKPAPDIYQRCVADLGLRPEECLALEDSGSGVLSARRAGIPIVIAVPNRYTKTHDFDDATAVLSTVKDALVFLPEADQDSVSGGEGASERS
ncbi:MAG: phosphatase [Candidatus Poribacteria bacterium]|nr:MAG: phosphatase [Candidatus Poribacteria bacterium]